MKDIKKEANWGEEFWKKFSKCENCGAEIPNSSIVNGKMCVCLLNRRVMDYRKIVDFIHTLISKERQVQSDIPMGVGQWKQHGKKWHYWEFFEKEIKEAEREKTLEDLVSRCDCGGGTCSKCSSLMEEIDILEKIKGG